MSLRTGLFAALLLGSSALPAWAADYYVAPLGAVPVSSPDGSKERPFASLDAALASGKIKGGDTLFLKDGSHGTIFFYMKSFSSTVTIRAENPGRAHTENILIGQGSGPFHIADLNVWPSNPYTIDVPLIETRADNISFENLDVRNGVDATNYMSWSQQEWLSRLNNGIMLNGRNNSVSKSKFTALRFAIQSYGPDSRVSGNRVDGFSGDAMRGLGNNNVFEDNHVSNCFQVDGNHADGFQSWAPYGVANPLISGLVLRGNKIVEWDSPVSSSLRCQLQGIGMYDGFLENSVFENNMIAVNHYHGIILVGVRNTRVSNNTVVRLDGRAESYPWIRVSAHKNGTPSQNVMVANNLAMSFAGADEINSVVFRDNRVVMQPSSSFQISAAFDYIPIASSGFLDVANASYAPATDILGNVRPAGGGPDLGAYEVGATGGMTGSDTNPAPTEPAPAPEPTTTTTAPTTTEPAPAPEPTTTTAPTAATTISDTTSGTTTTTTAPTTTTTTTTTSTRTAGKWAKPRSLSDFLARISR